MNFPAPCYDFSMRHLNPLLLVFLLALAPLAGFGQAQKKSSKDFVKWVDEKGTLNFTDDLNKIPPEFRSRAEPIDPRQVIEPRSKLTTFTFRPGIKQVVISAKLNDRASIKMWVDSNTAQSLLSIKAAKELGIDPNDPSHKKIELITPSEKFTVPVVKIDTVDLQGRVARNIHFAISDIADTENFLGILGQDFLVNFRTNFDQVGGKLTLEDKQ